MNDENYKLKAAECGIPDYMIDGVVRYIVNKVPPGSFLSAVFNNDLREAFGAADDTNTYCIRNYVMFLYNHAPSGCWGHSNAVKEWINQKDIT